MKGGIGFQPELENKQDFPGEGRAAKKGEGTGGREEDSQGQAKPRVGKCLDSIQGLLLAWGPRSFRKRWERVWKRSPGQSPERLRGAGTQC